MQQQKPLEGAQLVIMTIALSLATFMQVLDSTIANVAIPTIAGNLGSSLKLVFIYHQRRKRKTAYHCVDLAVKIFLFYMTVNKLTPLLTVVSPGIPFR